MNKDKEKNEQKNDEDKGDDHIEDDKQPGVPEPLMILRNDDAPSVDLKYQIKCENQNKIASQISL